MAAIQFKLERTLQGHEEAVVCVAVQPPPASAGAGDGDAATPRFLAASCSDTTINVWDIDRNVCCATLVGHDVRSETGFAWIWCVAFSPHNQKLLASAGGGRNAAVKGACCARYCWDMG